MSKAPTGGRRRVTFELCAEPGSEVSVAGSFNGWEPAKKRMAYKDGLYRASLLLPPGRYEYKFVIDGSWCLDPQCPDCVPNDQGSLNSVIVVGQPD